MADPRFVSGDWEGGESGQFFGTDCYLIAYEIARIDRSFAPFTALVTREVMEAIVERQELLRIDPRRHDLDELTWGGDAVYVARKSGQTYFVEPDDNGLYRLGPDGLDWAWQPVPDDSTVIRPVTSDPVRSFDALSRQLVHGVEQRGDVFDDALFSRRLATAIDRRARPHLEQLAKDGEAGREMSTSSVLRTVFDKIRSTMAGNLHTPADSVEGGRPLPPRFPDHRDRGIGW